jgi:hypothetical protein
MLYVDLLGTFPLLENLNSRHSLLALTIIDKAIGWFEIFDTTNELATSIKEQIHKTCLEHCLCSQFIDLKRHLEFGRSCEFKLHFF